ncbi:MAG: TPM domain-containing protein [Bifidobacteriaceae bacterium]|nr:TPM domain-containing protein [Bifidobacteriaceae bacterium]
MRQQISIRIAKIFTLLLAVFTIFPTFTAASYADSSSDQDHDITVYESITDTENLLGDDLNKVADAISKVNKETGVHIRLLYLSSFEGHDDAKEWVTNLLNSTNPDANTVLLAVATSEGKLVVAVSKNSDEWLSKQATVDELSDTALKPLTSGNTPNWSQSAIDLTNKIKVIHDSYTPSIVKRFGVFVLAGIFLIIVIAAIVIHLYHGKRKKEHEDKRKKGRRALRKKLTGRAELFKRRKVSDSSMETSSFSQDNISAEQYDSSNNADVEQE